MAAVWRRLYLTADAVRHGIIIGAFAVAVLLCTLEILGRHFDLIRWGGDLEELVRYLSAWIVFLGASVAMRRSLHFRVDYFLEKYFTPRGQVWVTRLSQIAMCLFLLVVAWFGILKTVQNLSQTVKAAPIPFAAFYLAIPVGSAYMLLDLLLIMRCGRHPFEPRSEEMP
jgi:TRAP-type C4-dicarboxylate transport system permease small subunit